MIEDISPSTLLSFREDSLAINVDSFTSLQDSSAFTVLDADLFTHQRDWRLIQDLGPHLVHHVWISRDTHVSDQSSQGSTLHARYGLWLGRGDGGIHPLATAITELLAQAAKVLDIARMHRQSMVWHIWSGAIRVNPSLKGASAAVEDIILIGSGQDRIEGHVEGQIHWVSTSGWSRAGGQAGQRALAD